MGQTECALSTRGKRLRLSPIVLIAVFAAAGCGASDDPAASDKPGISPAVPQEKSSAVIDADGATVVRTVGGVRMTATAPPGVADAGTSLTLSDVAPPGKAFPVEVASTAAARLVLGGGQQPRQPIELTFDLSAQPDMASQFNDSVKPIVRSTSDEGTVTDFAVAQWNPASKTVTATTDHLSIFQVIAADIGKAFQEVTKGWTNAGQSAPRSSCADRSELVIGSTKHTLTSSKPDAPVSGCLHDANGRVAVDFANGSGQYYSIISSPPGEFTNPAILHSDDQIAVWLMGHLGNRSGLLTPKSDGRLTLAAATAASIQVDVDPVALQLRTIFTGLDMLGIDADQLSEVFQAGRAGWDCITTAFDSVTQPAKPDVDAFRNSLGDIAQCGLAGAGAGWGANDKNFVLHRMSVATSLFAELPDQLIANVTGAIAELTGDNHLQFTLSVDESTQAPPPSTTALVPLVLKSHGSPGDSGTELAPNHFQLGHKLKDDDGNFYVSLDLRWDTNDDKAVAEYCTETSKVVDANGNVVVERRQDLGGCEYGGGWGFNISAPGTYTYILDVADRDNGGSVHAEQPFVVDP